MRGLARFSAEVGKACFAPRLWILGFWLGFALRCVALLCVYVRLHLVLFTAGEPVLPSLSVTFIMKFGWMIFMIVVRHRIFWTTAYLKLQS
jgi:hypothetical protein